MSPPQHVSYTSGNSHTTPLQTYAGHPIVPCIDDRPPASHYWRGPRTLDRFDATSIPNFLKTFITELYSWSSCDNLRAYHRWLHPGLPQEITVLLDKGKDGALGATEQKTFLPHQALICRPSQTRRKYVHLLTGGRICGQPIPLPRCQAWWTGCDGTDNPSRLSKVTRPFVRVHHVLPAFDERGNVPRAREYVRSRFVFFLLLPPSNVFVGSILSYIQLHTSDKHN